MGPIGAKSYFLPDLHHIHSEGTFLEVMNNGKVKFSKNLILVPIWPPQGGRMGAKWGQILFFARSSPFSHWRDLFASYEQWQSQIFEKLDFSPHLAPLKEPNGAKWGQNLFFAWSWPFSQWRDIFASYEQWQSQIFKKLDFSPHLAPLKEQNEAKSYFLPNLHHFHSDGTFLQVMNNGKV